MAVWKNGPRARPSPPGLSRPGHCRCPRDWGAAFSRSVRSRLIDGCEEGERTAVFANDNTVLIGAFFQLILIASVVAIPIVMFPILREHNVSLALGYFGTRVFVGISDAVIAISQLLLLTLSREFVKVGSPTTKKGI